MFQKHPILIPGRTEEGSTHWPTPSPIGLSHSHGRCGLEGEPRWQCAVPATRTRATHKSTRATCPSLLGQDFRAAKPSIQTATVLFTPGRRESHWKRLPAPSTLSKTPPQSPQGYERHTRAHIPHNDLMFSFKF